MAKRGRKPKERKGYFYEREEQAVKDYIASENETERNALFNEILLPAFTRMVESIIRKYKLYVPEEEFTQTFHDTLSYLITKVNNFKPNTIIYNEMETMPKELTVCAYTVSPDEFKQFIKTADSESPQFITVASVNGDNVSNRYYEKIKKHNKAFSYCGTICKNYLYYRNIQYKKDIQKNTPYDTVSDVFENDIKYSTTDHENASMAETLINEVLTEIKTMTGNPEEYRLNSDEIKVGSALSDLLENWEEILTSGSNKLQKSSVLYFLREQTMMTTKEVRDNSKCFKKMYYLLKKAHLS